MTRSGSGSRGSVRSDTSSRISTGMSDGPGMEPPQKKMPAYMVGGHSTMVLSSDLDLRTATQAQCTQSKTQTEECQRARLGDDLIVDREVHVVEAVVRSGSARGTEQA